MTYSKNVNFETENVEEQAKKPRNPKALGPIRCLQQSGGPCGSFTIGNDGAGSLVLEPKSRNVFLVFILGTTEKIGKPITFSSIFKAVPKAIASCKSVLSSLSSFFRGEERNGASERSVENEFFQQDRNATGNGVGKQDLNAAVNGYGIGNNIVENNRRVDENSKGGRTLVG